ncbi:putative addiction module toxin, RelE/StbE family [Magnetofaba australis IT-1]|uniref:Putative addiction module toxin, RelE/StbE family n=2 Tax=Magnetofaba TaxID=1472292 RepID=A0A1Y2KCZ4_9PROT|nr:putative addiction module toxin, RelE/StbE family [Magnetofaba australis IT-1]
MIVKWLDSAIADLAEIRTYIAQDNPDAASMVADRIVQITDHLKDYPNIGKTSQISNARELVIAGIPYKLVYRVTSNTVEILTVFHTSRKPNP